MVALFFSVKAWAGRRDGVGDARIVALMMLGISYAHLRSAGRVWDAGHPEICTTRYAGPK
jgi:hypothetical protein